MFLNTTEKSSKSVLSAKQRQVNKGGQLVKARLIVAGGYDERLLYSVQYEKLDCSTNKLNLNSY